MTPSEDLCFFLRKKEIFALGETSEMKESDNVIKWSLLIMGSKLYKCN